MSATDELRRMLDERGVEWKEHRHTLAGSMAIQRETLWGQPTDNASGKPISHVYHNRATEMGDGRLFVELQLATPEQAIAATLGQKVTGDTSDGYHTFNELYHHRAVLFSVIVANHRGIAWKARKHHDGTMYGGMFIVGIDTPWGQASYHYDLDPYWDMFDCEELESAPEWDGHTPDEAIERIGKLATLGVSDETAARQGDAGIKPCPFCGSNAETVHTLNVVPHEPWWIRCPSCGVTTPKYSSETDAITAWNRRVGDAE